MDTDEFVKRLEPTANEILKTNRALQDVSTYQHLAPGASLVLKFILFMLQRKSIRYPISWFTWLRECAPRAIICDPKKVTKFHVDNTDPVRLELFKLHFPSRPHISGGRNICYIATRPSGSIIEITNAESNELLLSIAPKDMFSNDSSRARDCDWITSKFKTMDDFLWLFMMLLMYDEKSNSLNVTFGHRLYLLGVGSNVLYRLDHECYIDGLF